MMEEQTTSPRQEDLNSKQKLTFQNRILSLGKATEIYSQNGAASLEEFAPVMEVLSSNRRRAFAVASQNKKQTLSFSQQRRLAGRKKLLILASLQMKKNDV
mgnify:CR=1 FL=1